MGVRFLSRPTSGTLRAAPTGAVSSGFNFIPPHTNVSAYPHPIKGVNLLVRAISGAGSGKSIKLVRLSHREIQMLGLIAEARPNKDIAFLMGITRGTLEQAISKMMRDLNLHNRGQMLIWALQKPTACQREWVRAGFHLPGCPCLEAYCTTMRGIIRGCPLQ